MILFVMLQLSPAFPSADVESKTLQGVRGELLLDRSGQHQLENTTLDFQKFSDKEILRIAGPLGADFTVKVRAQDFVRALHFLVFSKHVNVSDLAGDFDEWKVVEKL